MRIFLTLPLCLLAFQICFGSLNSEEAIIQKKDIETSKAIDLNNPIATSYANLDSVQELTIAESALREINKTGVVLHDAWVQDTLDELLNHINNQTLLTKPIAFLLIKDQNINAFAVSGGLIAINTGLIKQAANIDELAGVLSHEVAHLSQHHYLRSTENSKLDPWMQVGGIIASVLLARQDPDSATAIAVGTQAYVVDKQLAFSRDHEREADRIGMRMMVSAGFNPRSMATFFETLQKETRQVGQVPEYLQTHPLAKDRLSEAYLRASQLNIEPVSLSKNEVLEQTFHFLQLRIAALTKQTSVNALKVLAKTDTAAALALATVYTQLRDFSKARETVQPVLAKFPDMVLATITAAEVELAAQSPAQAIATLMPLLKQLPDNRALLMTMARAYILQRDADHAIQLLQPLVSSNPRDISLWQLLVDATEVMPDEDKKRLLILRYRAEVEFWQDNIDQAIILLTRAKSLAESYIQQAQIEKRLLDMKAAQIKTH